MSILLLIVVVALVAALVMTVTNRPAPARVPARVARPRALRRR